jgi:hypothetical protein
MIQIWKKAWVKLQHKEEVDMTLELEVQVQMAHIVV